MKSQRHKKQQWARANNPAAQARKRAKADAQRMALPPPVYGTDLAPGAYTGDWIGGRIHGHTVIYRLDAPLPTRHGVRPRSDQWRVVADGEHQVSPALGLVGAMLSLRHEFGRAPSRRELVGLQHLWTARDEADAAAAQAEAIDLMVECENTLGDEVSRQIPASRGAPVGAAPFPKPAMPAA